MPAVVVKGSDEFLRSEAVEEAVNSAGGCELVRVDADVEKSELSAVLDELRMKSLFSGAKALVIEGEKFLGENAAAMAEFIRKEMPELKDSLLVISAEKVPAAVAAAARKGGRLVEVKKMYATDYNSGLPSAGSTFGRWLSARARSMGLKMDEEAVVRAIEAAGENSRSADGLLKALAAGGARKVSVEEIERISGGEGAAAPYRLEDAVLAGDISRAMSIVETAYRQGIQSFDRYTMSEGGITAILARVLVAAVLNLKKLSGDPSEENARSMRLYSSRFNRYRNALRRLDSRKIELLAEDAFRTEFAFKAGIMDGRDMVEWLAMRIAGVEARSPESFGEAPVRR
ncbi:MAG: hypothetical protein JW909_12195 [Planctomycetes bacterium]|nr:hypothetical protein [Planctomycetota bacterium]